MQWPLRDFMPQTVGAEAYEALKTPDRTTFGISNEVIGELSIGCWIVAGVLLIGARLLSRSWDEKRDHRPDQIWVMALRWIVTLLILCAVLGVVSVLGVFVAIGFPAAPLATGFMLWALWRSVRAVSVSRRSADADRRTLTAYGVATLPALLIMILTLSWF